MPKEQTAAYREAVTAARAEAGPGCILEALHRLRGISLHTFDPDGAQDAHYLYQSARFRVLLEVLDHIHVGEKSLVCLEDLACRHISPPCCNGAIA